MAELTIITWWWGDKYSLDYVIRLATAVRRNLHRPHRFIVMTERERPVVFGSGIERHAIKDPQLCEIKGCLARLRMFDPGWQANRKITGRVINIDLDAVITGSLDDIASRDDDFAILSGVNTTNPCPYNGSLISFWAGVHPELWTDFSLENLKAAPFHDFPDDQGWIWHKVPKAGVFTAKHGVYAFQKVGWPPGTELPEGARLVAFPGWRDPSKFTQLPWVRKHWMGK